MSNPISFRAKLEHNGTYTVPAGFRAEFTANCLYGPTEVRIQGVPVGFMHHSSIPAGDYPNQIKPLTAQAGEVISCNGAASSFAIVGLLFPLAS